MTSRVLKYKVVCGALSRTRWLCRGHKRVVFVALEGCELILVVALHVARQGLGQSGMIVVYLLDELSFAPTEPVEEQFPFSSVLLPVGRAVGTVF